MGKVFLFVVVVVLVAAAVGGGAGAEGSDLRITSAEEFVNFATSGLRYSGTTVYLDSDITLTGNIGPINNFKGTFDGQGHTISNLMVNSSSISYVGLFGSSQGTTIRNVVIDSTSSFTNSFVGGSSFFGGIIGDCSTNNGPCIIENSINMASVTFNGNSSWYLCLGGIVGQIASQSSSIENPIIVRNCANYGPVTDSGISVNSQFGGIIGGNANTEYRYFQNCLNYGTITHNGTTTDNLEIGGIAGSIQSAYMENCLSAGRIFSSNTPSDTRIGTIAGDVYSSSITYSFFTNDVGNYNWYGGGIQISTTGTPSSPSTVPDALSALNTQVASSQNPWNRWLSNPNSVTVAFRVNNSKEISLASQAILLPDPADNNERTFSGWFTDETLSTPFDSSEVGTGTTLYGMFCGPSNYIVMLDVNGGDVSSLPSLHPMAIVCSGTYGTLPEPTKEGHRFVGWFSERTGGEMIVSGGRVNNPSNHSLYAHWDVNQYTVTFVSDGRTIKSEALDYGSSITYPDSPSKAGYSFNGWDKDIQTVPAQNITITATFTINHYTITFDFNNGTEAETRTLEYNASIEYPSIPSKTGHSFNGWDMIVSFVPAHNITITAQWTPNQYTVRLDVNGGDESSLPVKEVAVTFNSTYGALPVPNRSGFIFIGWLSEENVSVTSDTAVTTARNHSLRAQWSEILAEHVEVIFGTKDLSEEKIREIVEEYTNEEFTIVKIEDSDTDGLKVIIKFNDAEKAERFIANIKTSSEGKDIIEKVRFLDETAGSLSPRKCPHLFINAILLTISAIFI